MKKRFNPFTGSFDYIGTGSSATVDIGDIIKSILIDSDETLTLPKAEILFDSDSILYEDDTAL